MNLWRSSLPEWVLEVSSIYGVRSTVLAIGGWIKIGLVRMLGGCRERDGNDAVDELMFWRALIILCALTGGRPCLVLCCLHHHHPIPRSAPVCWPGQLRPPAQNLIHCISALQRLCTLSIFHFSKNSLPSHRTAQVYLRCLSDRLPLTPVKPAPLLPTASSPS
jgi:hypothetical protein